MFFCGTIHALFELWVHKGCNLYTVENVGGGIGQDPATEVTHLGLNEPQCTVAASVEKVMV